MLAPVSARGEILHVVLNTFVNDTRVLKEVRTLITSGQFTAIHVAALWEPGLAEREEPSRGLHVRRFRIRSRKLPKAFLLKPLKFLEALVLIFCSFVRAPLGVVHCHDLPALPIGIALKLIRGARLVYDAHEWEIDQAPGQAAWKRRFLYLLEKSLLPFADVVITVSPSIAKEYARTYDIPEPVLVLNCPPFRRVEKTDLLREAFGIPGSHKIFLYQGAFTEGRNLDLIAESFLSLGRKDCALVYMGYGPLLERLREYAKAPNIFVKDAVSPDVVLSYTASADIGVALGDATCTSFYYSMPNKLFEYAMAGLPVMLAPLYEFDRLAREYGIGIVVPEMKVEAIARTMEAMLEMDFVGWGDRLESFSREHSWEVQERRLLMCYGIGATRPTAIEARA